MLKSAQGVVAPIGLQRSATEQSLLCGSRKRGPPAVRRKWTEAAEMPSAVGCRANTSCVVLRACGWQRHRRYATLRWKEAEQREHPAIAGAKSHVWMRQAAGVCKASPFYVRRATTCARGGSCKRLRERGQRARAYAVFRVAWLRMRVGVVKSALIVVGMRRIVRRRTACRNCWYGAHRHMCSRRRADMGERGSALLRFDARLPAVCGPAAPRAVQPKGSPYRPECPRRMVCKPPGASGVRAQASPARSSPPPARQKAPEQCAAFVKELVHHTHAPRAADKRLAEHVQRQAPAEPGGEKRMLRVSRPKRGIACG